MPDLDYKDIRASEIEKGMHIREYGSPHEEGVTVKRVGMHGDTVLITGTNGETPTFDRDQVVEQVMTQPVIPTAKLRRMAKAPRQFPAQIVREALQELIERRKKD